MTLPGILASGGLMPGAPTIGTATDGGNGTSVNVAFTAPSWVGKGTGTVTYTATSSPGGLTGTSTSSPVTVSGLTAGTAYTFTVRATTSYGVTGPASASSNSVTPAVPTSYEYITKVNGNNTNSSVQISSIPSTYKHLQLRIVGSTANSVNNDISQLNIRLNGVTNSHNSVRSTVVGGSTRTFTSAGNASSFNIDNAMPTNVSSAAFIRIVDLFDYTSSAAVKTGYVFAGGVYGSTATSRSVVFGGLRFDSSSTISSIFIEAASTQALSTNFSVALYGIKE